MYVCSVMYIAVMQFGLFVLYVSFGVTRECVLLGVNAGIIFVTFVSFRTYISIVLYYLQKS